MPSSVAASILLRIAGCAIWAVTVAGPAVTVLGDGALLAQPSWRAWLAAATAWLAAFLYATRPAIGRPFPQAPLWVLAVESVAAVALATLQRGDFDASLVIPVAAQVTFVLSLRAAVTWAAAQTVALAASWVLLEDMPWGRAVLVAGAQAAFQSFAVGAALVAVAEAQARKDLACVNAGLLATRDLLAESTRRAERLRISRELHDSLGHRLTALHFELEAAGQGARTAELLAEVREVVAAVRDDSPVDLRRALTTLSRGIASPRVHLDMADDCRIESAAVAHALFRCVQEILTNAVRHADARNVWIDLRRDGEVVILHARDDGWGTARLVPGNGLTGMRERLEEIGGRLSLETASGRGFTVHASAPLAGVR